MRKKHKLRLVEVRKGGFQLRLKANGVYCCMCCLYYFEVWSAPENIINALKSCIYCSGVKGRLHKDGLGQMTWTCKPSQLCRIIHLALDCVIRWLAHLFGPDWNINGPHRMNPSDLSDPDFSSRGIALEFGSDTDVPLRMNCNHLNIVEHLSVKEPDISLRWWWRPKTELKEREYWTYIHQVTQTQL